MATTNRQDYRRNLMVGLFMLVALGGLATLVVLFGDLPDWLTGARMYYVHVYFDQLRGLTVGTEVEMNSIRIGRVAYIAPRDVNRPELGVDVVLEIQREYRIPQMAVAKVHEAPLGFGRPVVVIDVRQGQPGLFVSTDGQATLRGELISAFDQLIPRDVVSTLQRSARQIGDLAEALTPVADDLHELFVKRPIDQVDQDRSGKTVANLYTAVQRLNDSLKHFNEVLGDPQTKSNIRLAINNLRKTSEEARTAVQQLQLFAEKATAAAGDVRQITTSVSGVVERTDQQLQAVLRRVIDNADKLGRVLDHLEVAANSIASAKGSAGLLINDPRLYEELVLTARRLTAAVEDFRSLIKRWQVRGVAIEGVGLR